MFISDMSSSDIVRVNVGGMSILRHSDVHAMSLSGLHSRCHIWRESVNTI